MSFEVRVNGEKVWTTDNRVVRLSLQGGHGELAAVGIGPSDGVVDLFVEEAVASGAPSLDEIDEEKQAAIRAVPEGTIVGTPPYQPADDGNKTTQDSETTPAPEPTPTPAPVVETPVVPEVPVVPAPEVPVVPEPAPADTTVSDTASTDTTPTP